MRTVMEADKEEEKKKRGMNERGKAQTIRK